MLLALLLHSLNLLLFQIAVLQSVIQSSLLRVISFYFSREYVGDSFFLFQFFAAKKRHIEVMEDTSIVFLFIIAVGGLAVSHGQNYVQGIMNLEFKGILLEIYVKYK